MNESFLNKYKMYNMERHIFPTRDGTNFNDEMN